MVFRVRPLSTANSRRKASLETSNFPLSSQVARESILFAYILKQNRIKSQNKTQITQKITKAFQGYRLVTCLCAKPTQANIYQNLTSNFWIRVRCWNKALPHSLVKSYKICFLRTINCDLHLYWYTQLVHFWAINAKRRHKSKKLFNYIDKFRIKNCHLEFSLKLTKCTFSNIWLRMEIVTGASTQS